MNTRLYVTVAATFDSLFGAIYDRNLNLTGTFPQRRALAHKEYWLSGGPFQLRFPAQRSPPESGFLPLQVLLPLLGEADISPTFVEAIDGADVVILAIGRREASVNRAVIVVGALAFQFLLNDAFG